MSPAPTTVMNEITRVLEIQFPGFQGPPGPGGGGGAPGAPGDSAYAIAVAEGFVGTQAQWLASLVGPPGNLTVVGLPNDGDIIEYSSVGAAWSPTNSPRLLYLDGGNF